MLDGDKHFPKTGDIQLLKLQEKQESFGNYICWVGSIKTKTWHRILNNMRLQKILEMNNY